MFANLPQPIQEQILIYFATNNFPAAKALRDEYISYHKKYADATQDAINKVDQFDSEEE